jgi:hypothetical protein
MLDELKESAKTTIKERLTNPFYGALAISWILWNWQIVYVSFFVSEKMLGITKLNYILNNCNSTSRNFILPLISALTITIPMPYILNIIHRIILDQARKKKKIENIYIDRVNVTEKEYQEFLISFDLKLIKCQLNIIANLTSLQPKEYDALFDKMILENTEFINYIHYHLNYISKKRVIKNKHEAFDIDYEMISFLEKLIFLNVLSNGQYEINNKVITNRLTTHSSKTYNSELIQRFIQSSYNKFPNVQ